MGRPKKNKKDETQKWDKSLNKEVKGLKTDKIEIEIGKELPEIKFEGLPKDENGIRIHADDLPAWAKQNEDGAKTRRLFRRLIRAKIVPGETLFQQGDKVKLNKELLGDFLCEDHFNDVYEIVSCCVTMRKNRFERAVHYLITLNDELWGLTITNWFSEDCLILEDFGPLE